MASHMIRALLILWLVMVWIALRMFSNAHCLTPAGERVHKRAVDRGAQRIAVIVNRIQLLHVSFTCLKTLSIIITNVNNQHGCC